MAKYTIVAYLLWLLLGWTGAHHFYLRRDRQGLLWLTSVGGVFFTGGLAHVHIAGAEWETAVAVVVFNRCNVGGAVAI